MRETGLVLTHIVYIAAGPMEGGVPITLWVHVYTSVTLLMSCFLSLFIVIVVGFIGNATVNARESVGSFDVEVGIVEGIIGQTDSNILVDISAVDGTAQSKNVTITH